MKTTRTLFLSLLTGAAIAAAAAAPAQAMTHRPNRTDIGTPAMNGTAGRTIVIDAHTRWVNVTNGETVQFDVNGYRFAYTFDAWSNVNVVDLSAIAPGDAMAPMVRVYIAANPASQG
jgi:phosphate-selective porin